VCVFRCRLFPSHDAKCSGLAVREDDLKELRGPMTLVEFEKTLQLV